MADDIKNMLEAKRQLLLAISHELRTPITRAKVATSLMQDGKLKDGLEVDLNEMEAMISGLLEAEQFNQRHQALKRETTQINDLIKDVIAKHFPDEAIQTALSTAPKPLYLDKARFQFVIKNLLDNALKYRKNPMDEVILRSQIQENKWILSIEDHGIGIPEEHLSRLTEPFYRVDPSRQRETGGYGLGLYIIQKIVDAHHGMLTIQSRAGVGTTVTISLPCS